ncbi:MAG: hypothetical protein LBP33_04790 [Candidatus Adiutrix sp.]|jgi:hypothetical protein|nr:hypothetical protein [Candidatus Adiutrix sp.]
MFQKGYLVLASIMIMSFCLTGCMRQANLQNPTNLPVVSYSGKGLTEAQVRQAILLGAQEKGWIARELTPGVISATLTVRQHMAEVEIPYSANSYSILYKNSQNLDYNAKDRTIHNQYNNWVDYLRQAVNVQMTKMK